MSETPSLPSEFSLPDQPPADPQLPRRKSGRGSEWLRVEPEAEERPPSSGLDGSWQALDEEATHQAEDLVTILQAGYSLQESALHSPAPGLPGHLIEPALPSEIAPDLEDTTPLKLDTVQEEAANLPVADVTFYLVPQSNQHFLIGELARWVRRWLPMVCQTYGWQLEYLSVRPDYLRWTLKDFPETLIRETIQIVRQQTSRRIFRVFPNIRQSSGSSDFWASGYLVDTQQREFSTQALRLHFSREN